MSQLETRITRTSDREGSVVLGLAGEFDIANGEALRSAFKDALEVADRLVLDLTRAEFMDSSALGSMVAAHKRAGAAGGWVRLVAPSPHVRRVLEVTGLDSVLGVYDSTEQALTH